MVIDLSKWSSRNHLIAVIDSNVIVEIRLDLSLLKLI